MMDPEMVSVTSTFQSCGLCDQKVFEAGSKRASKATRCSSIMAMFRSGEQRVQHVHHEPAARFAIQGLGVTSLVALLGIQVSREMATMNVHHFVPPPAMPATTVPPKACVILGLDMPLGRFDFEFERPNASNEPKLVLGHVRGRSSIAVFSDKKLVEHILLLLPMQDLLVSQRISKALHKTITSSLIIRRRLYLAPAPPTRDHFTHFNPLLATIGSVSRFHQVHQCIHLSSYRPPRNLIIACHDRYYRSEAFFNYSSNPSLHADSKTGRTHVQWELRELSRGEVSRVASSGMVPDEHSSFWSMYLCQPPPMEVRLTIWKREDEDATGHPHPLRSNPPECRRARCGVEVCERFVLRAWTIRETLERMEDARDGMLDDGGGGGMETMEQRAQQVMDSRRFKVNGEFARSFARAMKLGWRARL